MTAGAPYDPGVSNERTALAWRRSALSLLVVGGLMLHAALDGPARPLQLATAAALWIAAGWVDRHGQRLYRARAVDPGAQTHSLSAVLAAINAVTALAAAVALLDLVG